MRVNGTVVREPGTKVEPDQDEIQVNGRPIPGRSALRYYMLHKPVGVITTLHDPERRRTVRDLFPPGPRLFPVGRLDADTSGLLVLTNDGELAHHLMHPRYGLVKLYRVTLDRMPGEAELRRLRGGVAIEPGVESVPAEVRILGAREGRVALDVRIHEGRHRQVRRMCEAVGLEVKKLHRYGYGPLRLERLPRGACRPLTTVELRRLRAASARPGGTAPLRRAPRPSRTAGAGPRVMGGAGPRARGGAGPRARGGAGPRARGGAGLRATGSRPPAGRTGRRSGWPRGPLRSGSVRAARSGASLGQRAARSGGGASRGRARGTARRNPRPGRPSSSRGRRH